MASGFRVSWEWSAQARLDDGAPVTLRLLRPTDRERVARGFARLSPETRYRRFLSPKPRLTDAELSYLTETDGVDHVAIVAFDERGEGLGIARFFRLPGEPDVAEPAVTVIDEAQGRGLGKLLLAHLAEAARERGIARFRSTVLADNRPMRALLREAFPDVTQVISHGEVVADAPLPGG